MANNNLSKAKSAKNDEFYTTYEDVEKELQHYKSHFENKIVFCNCNDSEKSAFWQFFYNNFNEYKLRKLIGVYSEEKQGYKIEYDGKEIRKEEIEGEGDFRSDMSLELLKQSDIVVTNPPFSLFRDYIAILMKYNKQFLIIGNMNAITYKEFFPLVKENKIWVGYGFNQSFVYTSPYKNNLEANRKFVKSKGYNPDTHIKVPACCWYTNLDHPKRHQKLPLDLGFTYKNHEDMYPKYDNYDAINVDKVTQIPCDYEPCWYKCPKSVNCKYAQSEGQEDNALCENQCNGEMGVPISFMDKYCPEQFDIVRFRKGNDNKDLCYTIAKECSQFVNVERDEKKKRKNERRKVYCRIVICKLP